MADFHDLRALDDALNDLAKLYQFRSVDERLFGPLTVSQSYCLRILYFQGPRTMGELAADLDVRVSTMTGVVDQLEDAQLVERVNHPDDRRSLKVQLTITGRRLYRGAHDAFLSHLQPLVGGRTPSERRQILAFLAEVVHVVQGWRDRPRKVRGYGKKNSERGSVGRRRRTSHLRASHRR